VTVFVPADSTEAVSKADRMSEYFLDIELPSEDRISTDFYNIGKIA
jgi:hypothetical protein